VRVAGATGEAHFVAVRTLTWLHNMHGVKSAEPVYFGNDHVFSFSAEIIRFLLVLSLRICPDVCGTAQADIAFVLSFTVRVLGN
jgi:hypothetical protein